MGAPGAAVLLGREPVLPASCRRVPLEGLGAEAHPVLPPVLKEGLHWLILALPEQPHQLPAKQDAIKQPYNDTCTHLYHIGKGSASLVAFTDLI